MSWIPWEDAQAERARRLEELRQKLLRDDEQRVREELAKYEEAGWEVVWAVGNRARLYKGNKQKDVRIERYHIVEHPEVLIGS